MTTHISNEFLQASIKSEGAELTSLKNRDGTEFLWQADPAFWPRHAPVLFPIVGKLKGNEFVYQNKSYQLGQHGFARDLPFKEVAKRDTEVTYSLSSDYKTRAIYPFDFSLTICYSLRGHMLDISYKVQNPGSASLLFSIGGHPAFNCPLYPDEKREDYAIHFEVKEPLLTHRLKEGLFDGSTTLIGNGVIPVSNTLFNEDALVFKDLQSTKVSLERDNQKILTFHFNDFPYLGIWSKNELSPFVCLEPWFGLADRQDHTQILNDKEGIRILEPGEGFKSEYSIEIH